MKIGITPLTYTIINSPHKLKNQSVPFFSYDIPTEETVQAADNSTVNINEEYEKFLSESSGIKAALSSVPTYSVSSSQAEYLAQKYDLNNMPQNSVQEREFLNELVSMNIIGEKDARLFNFNCGGSVESVSSCVSVVPFGDEPIPMWEDCYIDSDNIIERLMSVIDTQKNICAYYNNKCIDIENAKKCDLNGAEASREFLSAKEKVLLAVQSIYQMDKE